MKFQAEFDKMKEVWGEDAQVLVAIEELGELVQALVKYLRLKQNKSGVRDADMKKIIAHIQEESADVLNCVKQMAQMFGMAEVQKIRGEKVERTMKIIEGLK